MYHQITASVYAQHRVIAKTIHEYSGHAYVAYNMNSIGPIISLGMQLHDIDITLKLNKDHLVMEIKLMYDKEKIEAID